MNAMKFKWPYFYFLPALQFMGSIMLSFHAFAKSYQIQIVKEAPIFMKHIAMKLANSSKRLYSDAMSLIRPYFTIALEHSKN